MEKSTGPAAAAEQQQQQSPPSPTSVALIEHEKERYIDNSSNSVSTAQLEDGATPSPSLPPEDSQVPEEHDKLNKNTLLIVLSLCVCLFLSALDQTIITTAIPVISSEFQSSSAYTWIGTSYLLASSAFLPSWGKFSDIWGRKPVLLAAAVLFMIGSVLCAAARSITLMLIGRVLQGLGAGGQLGLVNVTISDIVTVRQRGLYLSYIGMTWAVASAIGPVLGGVFTGMAGWGWRFCFIINIPVGFVGILGLYLFLHLQSPTISLMEGLKRVDWLGTIFIVAGVVLALLGLEFGGVMHPWKSAIVLCFLVFGFAFLVCFIIVEWKFAKLPIMPLRLFTNRTNASCYLVSFCHGIVFLSGCYFIPLYFQAVRGDTPLMSGIYVLPYVISLSVTSGSAGLVISRTGRYQEIIWAGVSVMALGSGLFVKLTRTSSWAELIIFQLIAGTGAGPLFQAPLIAVHATIAPEDVATATSTFAFLRSLGTALAVSLGLIVFQNGMAKQAGPGLTRKLGAEAAGRISGDSASASIEYIKTLTGARKTGAQDAYAEGMRGMWWFFMAISLVAVACSVFIGKHHLSKQLNSSQPAIMRPKKGQKAAKAPSENV